MIRFLANYTTKSIPPEVFTKGQELSDRSPESELHFVSRGVAGFLIDGVLFDQDHRPIAEPAQSADLVDIADTSTPVAAPTGGAMTGAANTIRPRSSKPRSGN